MNTAEGQMRSPLLLFVALSGLVALTYPCGARSANLEQTPSAVQFLMIDEDVNEQIAKIDKLAERQEWRKIIEICQKFIAEPPTAVVEIRKGVYGSARAVCESKLEALPEPARLLYRTLYDPEAERLYEAALNGREVEAAHGLVTEFALTSHGPDGMRLLADLLFERGDLRGALGRWRRWTEVVGTKEVPEAVRRLAAVKMAIAAAKLGDRQALNHAVGFFGAKGAVVEAGGKKIARSEELEQFAAGLWLKADRSGRSAPDQIDFERWNLPLDTNYYTRTADYYGSSHRPEYACDAQVQDGVVYVNTPEGPQALDALTGRLIWKRGIRGYESDYYRSPHSFNFYCRVYPAVDRPGKKTVFISGGTQLAACDAGTGRLIWSKNRNSFRKLKDIGGDRELRVAFSSPVLCRGRRAYVTLETSQAEVHLLALDRSTGAVLWVTAVGGSAASSGYRVSFPAAITVAGSDLVFYNGRGIIGKCDASTGEIRWLLPYRRRERFVKERYSGDSERLQYRPMVNVGDSVVCMPTDGEQIFSIRISDGRINWQKDTPPAGYLLGGLAPTGDETCHKIFVTGARVECLRADTGSVVWTWPLPETGALGLGRVTDKAVVLATHRGVYALDAASGELTRFEPLRLGGTGEVHVASDGDSLVLLSRGGLRVLGGKARTRELLKRAAEGSPPGPWLTAIQARLDRREGHKQKALRGFARAIELAKRKAGGAKLAASLQWEVIGFFHELQAADWKAGRRVDAFGWMRRALHSPARTPYQCKLGYRSQAGRDPSVPHTLVMASGDKLSGKLGSIDQGLITFVLRGEPWRIAAAGVNRIIVGPGLGPAEAEGPGAAHVVLANGDRISCTVKSLRNDVLQVQAEFGSFEVKLPDVAALVFGGTPPKLSGKAVYVRLRNGDELSGQVRAFDGTDFILDVPFCGKRRIRVKDVHTISNHRRMPALPVERARLDYGYPGGEGPVLVHEGPAQFAEEVFKEEGL